MSETYKREWVFIVAGIAAIIAILSYYFSGVSATGVADQLYQWALIIQLMAIGLGAINLIQLHYRNIQKRTKGLWYNSVWLMVFFVILIITGLMYLVSGKQPYVYNWSFTYVYTSLSSTLYAITGFYIFSADLQGVPC